jgi:hypothetical protein
MEEELLLRIDDTLESIKEIIEERLPKPPDFLDELFLDCDQTGQQLQFSQERLEAAPKAQKERAEASRARTAEFLTVYKALRPAGKIALLADMRFLAADDTTVCTERSKLKLEAYDLLEQAARSELEATSRPEQARVNIKVIINFDTREVQVFGIKKDDVTIINEAVCENVTVTECASAPDERKPG